MCFIKFLFCLVILLFLLRFATRVIYAYELGNFPVCFLGFENIIMLCSFQRIDLWLTLRFLLLMYSVMFLPFLENHPFCLDFTISWFIVWLSFLILIIPYVFFSLIFWNQTCQRLVCLFHARPTQEAVTGFSF